MMPGRHGAELLGALAAVVPGTPIVVSSGFTRDGELGSLAPLGIAAYLAKPVRRTELAAVLVAATRPR